MSRLIKIAQTDDVFGPYGIPRGFACIDDSGSLRPTGGKPRTIVHCQFCEHGPFRSAKCFFADCSSLWALARAREREREQAEKTCAFPGCIASVAHDSYLCRRHHSHVLGRMRQTGQDYEAALADLVLEAAEHTADMAGDEVDYA